MPDKNEQQPITYQVGNMTFIVEPVFKPEGESLAAILLRLMKADVERV